MFTDSSHRDDDSAKENMNNASNAMDIDLRNQTINDEQEKISLSNSPTDISFVCVRKPSSIDRTRLEDITKQAQCSFSKIYSLLNQEVDTTITITTEMIHDVISEIKSDILDVFISVLKCGHYESQLAVYSKIKPAIL